MHLTPGDPAPFLFSFQVTPMPDHKLLPQCVRDRRGALVFTAPDWLESEQHVKAQIIDLWTLDLVTGYDRDARGTLQLSTDEPLPTGRHWTLAKAAQLARNSASPERWVVLQLHKQAWGLFWAGGGLDYCRRLRQAQAPTRGGAIVPATSEALLVRLAETMAELARRTETPQPVALLSRRWLGLGALALTLLLLLGGGLLVQQQQQLQRMDQQLRLLRSGPPG